MENLENPYLAPEGPEENPVILEIGPSVGAATFFPALRKRVADGARYIGIDCDENALDYKRHGMERVVGDLGKLPIKNNSADEVYLLNIFGNLENLPTKTSGSIRTYTLGVQRHFEELARVTKPGGKVIIGEWYYPVRRPYRLTQQEYGEFGFEKEVIEGEKLVSFLKELGVSEESAKWMIETFKIEHPFVMILKKTSKE